MVKERPIAHVIDAVCWNPPRKLWPYWREVAKLAPRAKRFILTEDASVRLGEIVRDTEPLLLKSHQFALPPYPVTYVELDAGRFIDTLARANTADAFGDPADDRVGYLISGDGVGGLTVHVVASGADSAVPGPFVLRKRSGRPSIPVPKGISADPVLAKMIVLLGTGVHSIEDDETFAALDSEWALTPAFAQDRVYHDAIKIFAGASGELRTLIALLLVLNQPDILDVHPVARQSGIRRGKRVVYAAHNTVEIKLGRRRNYTKIFRHLSERASPRRHTVRGHFVHYHLSEECIHNWPLYPEESPAGAPTWTCRNCGGKRTWRKVHERGDAGIGFVTKDYKLS